MVGLCLERLPPNSKSKFRIAEWQVEMIKCFVIAGDLTLVYLQEQDKISMQQQNGSVTVNSNNIGTIKIPYKNIMYKNLMVQFIIYLLIL